MDLVYANRERQDIGVLRSPELDLAFGSEENDFECKIPLADACCDSGYLIYAEGTEYGGIVDNITVDTASDSVTYSGRTWHGVLGSKCVLPLQEGEGLDNYTMLEYIEGTGIQYIDTGVKPTEKTKVIITVSTEDDSHDKPLFGARTNSSSNDFFVCWFNPQTASCPIINYGKSGIINMSTGITKADKHTLILENGSIEFDEAKRTFNKSAAFATPCNLVLFGLSNNGAIDSRKFYGRIYTCELYEDGELIRKFMPCKTASGSVGMYDFVNATFYPNSGTGEFLAGAELSQKQSGVTLETYGGNNLFNYTGDPYDQMGMVFNHDIETQVFLLSGTTASAGNLSTNIHLDLAAEKTYTLCLRHVSGKITWNNPNGTLAAFAIFDKSNSKFKRYILPSSYASGDVSVTFSASDFNEGTNEFQVMLQVWNIGAVFDNFKFHIQIVEGAYTVGNLPPYEPHSAAVYNRYFAMSGDANRCISYLIDRVGLSDLFSVPEDDAGVNVSKYQFERYTDAYSGLHNMLASCGMRLNAVHTDGAVMLSAVPAIDYSQEKEFESQLIPFVSKAYKNKVNHLICLGSGELENRLVVHLYADADGNISETQTYYGVDEYAAVYDYPNAGSIEGEEVTEEDKRNELIASGKERFKELRKADTIDIDFDIADDAYYIGDIVGTLDSKTGISVTAEVKKKIVTLKNNHVNISYIVG